MPDGVKAESLDLCQLTQPLHEVHTLLEGLADLLQTETSAVFANENVRAVLERPVVPPPVQGFCQLACKGQPVVFHGAAEALFCKQPDAAIAKIHIFPLQSEHLTATRPQMEVAQQHDAILSPRLGIYLPEVFFRRNIARGALLRESLDQTRVLRWQPQILDAPVPCGDQVFAILVQRISTSPYFIVKLHSECC